MMHPAVQFTVVDGPRLDYRVSGEASQPAIEAFLNGSQA
jgi:hypothetical protein